MTRVMVFELHHQRVEISKNDDGTFAVTVDQSCMVNGLRTLPQVQRWLKSFAGVEVDICLTEA